MSSAQSSICSMTRSSTTRPLGAQLDASGTVERMPVEEIREVRGSYVRLTRYAYIASMSAAYF